MEMFIAPLIGGIMIGLASAGLMYFNGRIAGISGIYGGLVDGAPNGDAGWRASFVGGLLLGGLILLGVYPEAFPSAEAVGGASWAALAPAGLLVGFGTRLGSGCTSGHGVCGMSRMSPRSIAAVLVFIAAGAVAVFIARHVGG